MIKSKNNVEVAYLPKITEYLNELIDTLFYKEYFGTKDSAKKYVVDMKDYIDQNIAFLLKKPAPPYFLKYGKSMQYVTYNPNKHTTWYIFFQQKGNQYLIRYITNNHIEGQYIR